VLTQTPESGRFEATFTWTHHAFPLTPLKLAVIDGWPLGHEYAPDVAVAPLVEVAVKRTVEPLGT
jgi:hypothetical protein